MRDGEAGWVRSVHTLPYGDRPVAAAGAGPPASGLVLGRYRLRERLGAGGFGVVWAARDERLDRDVAVKRIVLAPGAVPDRVTREALASARLAHPAIVALYEAAPEENAFCLVSELVHGSTLAELIAGDALADEEVLAIGRALCDGLAHAHERGVIHRDVKPHNVLVPDPPGVVAAKLADFGGAWITGEDPLTRTGDVMGTLAYMAPEQAEGGEVDERCDLYSCALVCFEALSGVNPVRGATPAATARNIGRELPSLHDYRPDLPGELVAAIDVALDPEPEYRGELSELRAALELDLTARAVRRGWFRARPRLAVRVTPPAGGAEDDAAATAVRRETRAREAVVWPQVDWEGAEPHALTARRGAGDTPGDSRGRAAAGPPRPARPPGANPALRPLDVPASEPERRAVQAPAPVPERRAVQAPRLSARLALGAGAGALAAGALYGLGGATQQLALAGALLAAGATALLPRLGWLVATTAVCAWLAAAGAPGSALVVLLAALPVPLLLRPSGPAWLVPVGAPLLGLAGLAAAFPALAGQLAGWSRRAGAGALGYWWLALAETLLGRHLWLGPPVGAAPRALWEGSLTRAAHDAVGPTVATGVLLGALLWGVGAAVLPWLVRGRHAAVDVVAAAAWTLALALAAPLVDRGALSPAPVTTPRGLVLGAILAGLFAVTARAARGAG